VLGGQISLKTSVFYLIWANLKSAGENSFSPKTVKHARRNVALWVFVSVVSEVDMVILTCPHIYGNGQNRLFFWVLLENTTFRECGSAHPHVPWGPRSDPFFIYISLFSKIFVFFILRIFVQDIAICLIISNLFGGECSERVEHKHAEILFKKNLLGELTLVGHIITLGGMQTEGRHPALYLHNQVALQINPTAYNVLVVGLQSWGRSHNKKKMVTGSHDKPLVMGPVTRYSDTSVAVEASRKAVTLHCYV
jgi:hypothetical protein